MAETVAMRAELQGLQAMETDVARSLSAMKIRHVSELPPPLTVETTRIQEYNVRHDSQYPRIHFRNLLRSTYWNGKTLRGRTDKSVPRIPLHAVVDTDEVQR